MTMVGYLPDWAVRIGAAVDVVTAAGGEYALSGKNALVVAVLGLEGRAERRRVAMLLWPDSAEAQARNNLRTAVHRINQRAGFELVVGGDALALADVQVRRLEGSDAVLAALQQGGIRRCELLAEAGLDGEPGEELQAWLKQSRQRLRQRQLAGLAQALEQAQAQAQHAQAVSLAQACVQLDPLSEATHRQLMEVLAASGDRAAALSAYEDCKAWLKQELGVLPGLPTRTVQLRILQEQALGPRAQQHAPEPGGLTPLGGAAKYTLVEREAVLQAAQQALAQGVHVALAGEPGVGKTRLLRQLATLVKAEQVAVLAGARGEAYAALAQLLQELHPRHGVRVGVPEQIELARLAPMAFAEVTASQAPLSVPRLHAALRQWMRGLGQAGVKVLVIDDVHDADAASQAALGALLQGEDADGMPALVLAHRSGDIDAALEDALLAAQVRHRVRRMDVPRLTLTGVQALLRAMDLDAAQAPRLLQRTGGNPLFVIELAQATQATQATQAAHATQATQTTQAEGAADLQALLRRRVEGCSTAAQQLAAVAAVASDEFTVELASAVTGHGALALMPAWAELQQRGIFADHGLAHDLVGDALRSAMPLAIRRLMHRQVALHLQAQDQQGASVLRHWLAADDPDQALPHAVHQLHEAFTAGLNTHPLERELLALLQRASDAVLLRHLWVTAEVNFDFDEMSSAEFEEVSRLLQGLIERVRRLAREDRQLAWVAFEEARQCCYGQGNAKAAYDKMLGVIDRLAEHSVERALTAVEFMRYAIWVGAKGREAIVLGAAAELAGLADLPQLRRAGEMQRTSHAYFIDPVPPVLQVTRMLRAARRRGDLGQVLRSELDLGRMYAECNFAMHAMRHYGRAMRLSGPDGIDALTRYVPYANLARPATESGHYAVAWKVLRQQGDQMDRPEQHFEQGRLYLRLGMRCEARQALLTSYTIDPPAMTPLSFLRTKLLAELDQMEGHDPMVIWAKALEKMNPVETTARLAHLCRWQAARFSLSPAELADMAREYYKRWLQPVPTNSGPGLIEVAEALVAVGDPEGLKLAARVAWAARRGMSSMYVPAMLVRCARLLRAHDPREASALVHVARRWVQRAQAHVPPEAAESFTNNVPVNRLLLGDDEDAVYTETLAFG
jgi:DNA-binding SARP family transcriptional activator/tetratricopeptide (TPR) repeat protein/energy-coupling factor transporter ATP-binding protein EcfA2